MPLPSGLNKSPHRYSEAILAHPDGFEAHVRFIYLCIKGNGFVKRRTSPFFSIEGIIKQWPGTESVG